MSCCNKRGALPETWRQPGAGGLAPAPGHRRRLTPTRDEENDSEAHRRRRIELGLSQARREESSVAAAAAAEAEDRWTLLAAGDDLGAVIATAAATAATIRATAKERVDPMPQGWGGKEHLGGEGAEN